VPATPAAAALLRRCHGPCWRAAPPASNPPAGCGCPDRAAADDAGGPHPRTPPPADGAGLLQAAAPDPAAAAAAAEPWYDSAEAEAAEEAVRQLLLHPRQQAQQLQERLGGGAGGSAAAAGWQVLPEYLDALAHAATDPEIGGSVAVPHGPLLDRPGAAPSWTAVAWLPACR
jgi:hypothetical protein